jgi:hypothetical protein
MIGIVGAITGEFTCATSPHISLILRRPLPAEGSNCLALSPPVTRTHSGNNDGLR